MSFRETLDYLKSVEKRCGRIREENKFIPRTLDLDIIDWNSEEAIIEGSTHVRIGTSIFGSR